MTRWEQSEFVARAARKAEVKIVRLGGSDEADTGERPASAVSDDVTEWRLGFGPLPPLLVIRQSRGSVEIALDVLSPAAQTVERISDEPAEYITASAGVGALFGALVGRTSRAAALGGFVGGLLGALSALDDRRKT